MDIFRSMGQIKKKSNVETAGAGNYITVFAEANFKGSSERFEVCFSIPVLIILLLCGTSLKTFQFCFNLLFAMVRFDLHLVKLAVVNIDGAAMGFAECKKGAANHFWRISKQRFPAAAAS